MNVITKLRVFFFEIRCVFLAQLTYITYRCTSIKKLVVPGNTHSITHINTFESVGGAAKIAHDLYTYTHTHNWSSHMVVACKQSADAHVIEMKPLQSKKQIMLHNAERLLQWQYFFHLSSFELLQNEIIAKSSIVHLHNLHNWNGYFSPFVLPQLSATKHVVWTLHDMHSITGHCAHSFDCNKWQTGCGNCPHLDLYPKITKDTSHFIWETKRILYKKSNMHIVVPSKWLQLKVQQSILGHLPCTLIYNGINTSIYKPYNKQEIRNKLGIPHNKTIVLFSADLGMLNPYKGGEYIQKLIAKYEENNDILFVNIGGAKSVEKLPTVWNIPYVTNQESMAQWYSAADVYVYPSLADNCPLVVLEAMACGLPIVTFNTGGIPELVLHESTGYVAGYKNFDDICAGFELLINNIEIRKSMGEKSIERVHKYFTIEKMNQQYLNLYYSIIN